MGRYPFKQTGLVLSEVVFLLFSRLNSKRGFSLGSKWVREGLKGDTCNHRQKGVCVCVWLWRI